MILDVKLSWRNHINFLRAKLSSVCGVLGTIRPKITLQAAKLIYYALAYSYMNYGNIIWNAAAPTILNAISNVQKRLIRIIAKKKWDVHTSPLFVEFKILKFIDICKLVQGLFVFKCMNNLIDAPIQFNARLNQRYNLRNLPILTIPYRPTTQSQRFVEYVGAELWNNLPNNIKCVATPQSFKVRMKKISIVQLLNLVYLLQ